MKKDQIVLIKTRFYIDQKIYDNLRRSKGSDLVIEVIPKKGKHPKGIYIIPFQRAIDFIESKMNSYNWEMNHNFHQDSIPSALVDYFEFLS